jgi:drug/metabolite transporter (DMT)-like permease
MLGLLIAGSAAQGVANILFKLTAEKSVGFLPLAAYFGFASLLLLVVVAVREPQAFGQSLANPLPYVWALAAAVVLACANYLLFTALATIPASVAFSVYNIGCTLVTVLIGVFLLQEKLTALQLAGVALSILSVALMTWPKGA